MGTEVPGLTKREDFYIGLMQTRPADFFPPLFIAFRRRRMAPDLQVDHFVRFLRSLGISTLFQPGDEYGLPKLEWRRLTGH